MIISRSSLTIPVMPELGRAVRIETKDIAQIITDSERVKNFAHEGPLVGGEPVWKLFPHAEGVSPYTHEWGYALQKSIDPQAAGMAEAFFGGESSELIEAYWPFSRAPFPFHFLSKKESAEVRPLFYEAIHDKRYEFGNKSSHSRARVFIVFDDKVEDIGSYERRPGQSPVVTAAESADYHFFTLESGPDFTFSMRRID